MPHASGMTIAKGYDWLERYKLATGHDHPYKAVADAWAGEISAAKKVAAKHVGKVGTGAEVRAAFEEIGKKYDPSIEPLTKRMEELKADVSKKYDDALSQRLTHSERSQIYSDARNVNIEISQLRREIADHTSERSAELRKLLYVDDPISVDVNLASRFAKSDPRSTSIAEGVSEVQKMVSVAPNLNTSVTIRKAGKGRSSASSDGTTINLTAHSDTETVVHELGHWLEDNNTIIRARVFRFYEARTAGEPLISMNRAANTSGYRASERTRMDKFIDAYMGKDYTFGGRRRSTEILSMGLQMFYSDPIKLARQDPEYFDFIYAVTRGME